MSAPIVFISHFRVKQGERDGLREVTPGITAQLESDKPATLLFLSYLDADGSRATFVHAFGDSESMDRHFEGANERSRRAAEYLEPISWEIYGPASDTVVKTMREVASGAGVPLTLEPDYLAGFLRLASS